MSTDLYIIQSSRWWLPMASVEAGSTHIKGFVGITRWHALGRAAKWARRRATRFVYVQKWAPPTHGEEEAP